MTGSRRSRARRLLSCALLAGGLAVPLAAQPVAPDTVAILYDGPATVQAKGHIHALFIENLLGHFSLSGDVIPLADYQPGQLQQYRAAFFVGATPNTQVPPSLLADVLAYRQPFCWLGQHVEQLLAAAPQLGFRFDGYSPNRNVHAISYKGALLPKEEPDLALVAVTDQSVQVVASALEAGKISHPYAIHKGRFWYFADSPFAYPEEGAHYLVFCDLLHDILEIEHGPDQRALVRIEDVSTDEEPDNLRRVADLLSSRHIPFQIAVIPVFRNPAKEEEVRLTDRRSTVDAIRYMIARGGTPVLHGITHQYRTQTGDDYEFWDDTGDRPIVGDSAEFVMRRLQLGLSECFAAGIFPVAFETPHYAASETDYRALMRVFSLFYDWTMSTPSLNSLQYYPYPTTDRWGRRVIPENVGYLPLERPDPNAILEHARNLKVVRDGLASMYFHPFLDVKLLDQTVRGIAALGYHFVSLKEFTSEVDYQGRYVIRTASGKTEMRPQGEYWRERVFDGNGKLVETEFSVRKSSGPAEVAVNVPPGGWAALDCVKEIPAEQREGSWTARLQQFWGELWKPDRATAAHSFATGKQAWILWLDKAPPDAQNDQQSYRAVLDTFGYQARLVKIADFRQAPATNDVILIVPAAAGARLSDIQQSLLLRYVNGGGQMVAEGRQTWAEKLGIRWQGRQVTVGSVGDEIFPEMTLKWQPEERVERFEPPDNVRELMLDTESDQVLAFSGDYGAGRYIYLAVPLDPHTADGTSHYPYFAKYLNDIFGAATSLRSPRIEAYFDPSYRAGADFNRLATQWRKSGIRIVYAAAWIFYSQYQFNYEEFVKACHRNGVAVYAWFVPPATTPVMWDQHPEWREKTASGADGRVGWRFSMNFQNPGCFRAAMDWMKSMLAAHDWDGVNITELNFDADFENWLQADKFVPFNADVRADFRQRAGFDPVELFAPASPHYFKTSPGALGKFLRYREDIVTEWHRKVLGELEPLRRQHNWEIIVTALDSLHSKYVRPALGVDSRRIAGLMKDFKFTLQVEDPAEHWMRPPDRYLRFAQTYYKLVKDRRRLMFDVNVVTDRDVDNTFLPSAVATGMELARTVVAAASASGRVAIYSEHTVPAQDWTFLRIALAKGGAVRAGRSEWRVESPAPALLGPSEDRDYYLDGRLWPAVSIDGVLAPAGRHWLSTRRPWYHFLDPGALPARLVSMSGDLLEARVMPTGLLFRYSSPGRAVAVLNQRPRQMILDGRETALRSEQAGENWTMTLPGGEHWVAVVTNTRAGVAVNLWSWASASAIAAFGTLATLLMGLIYFEVRVRRWVKQLVARSS